MNAGVQPLELGEHHREHRAARARRGADLEPPGQLALGVADKLGEQLLLESEQALRAAVEPLPGLGRLDPAARAVEQLQPEPFLERADLQADRRLRHAELLGRLGEAAPLDDCAECCKLARIHKQRLCTDGRATNHLASSGCPRRRLRGSRTR